MRKITGETIADFSPSENGFVFTSVNLLESGSQKVSFYSYDAITDSAEPMITPVTKKTYAQLKFGGHGAEISEQLGNNAEFLFNDCTRFYNNSIVALDDNGNFSRFSPDGVLEERKRLLYREKYPTSSPAAYKHTLWCAVSGANSIVNYCIEDNKIHVRVIGLGKTIFDYPQSITIVDNNLYVCNRDSGKINFIQLDKSYQMGIFKAFKEPVYKYIRSCDKDFVLLESGIYEVEPNEFKPYKK